METPTAIELVFSDLMTGFALAWIVHIFGCAVSLKWVKYFFEKA